MRTQNGLMASPCYLVRHFSTLINVRFAEHFGLQSPTSKSVSPCYAITLQAVVRWAGALLIFGGFTLDFVSGSDEQAN